MPVIVEFNRALLDDDEKGDSVSRMMEVARANGVTAAALAFRRDLVRELSKAGTGLEYTKDGEVFRAGVPGSPPGRGKGVYVGSIQVEAANQARPARVFTNEPIAEALEETYPHFSWVFERNKQKYIELYFKGAFIEGLNDEIRKNKVGPKAIL